MHLTKVGGTSFRSGRWLSPPSWRWSGRPWPGASAISHDLYARVIKKGTATVTAGAQGDPHGPVGLGIAAIVLGIAFKDQNVLFPWWRWPSAWPSSVNFPVLILSMYWKGLTTRGAPGRHRRPGVVGGPGDPVADRVGQDLRQQGRDLPSPMTTRPSCRCRWPSSSPGCCRSPTRASVRRGSCGL